MRVSPSWLKRSWPKRFAVASVLAIVGASGVSLSRAEGMQCPSESQIAKGKTQCLASPSERAAKTDRKPKPVKADTLPDVIMLALERHPQVRIARARVQETAAGIDVAKANGKFQLDGVLGVGYGGVSTSLDPLTMHLLDRDHLNKQFRNELTITGKQLIFDFGANETGVLRAVTLRKSEDYNLAAKIDEIAYQVAEAYFKVVEARELSRLNKDNIEALQKIQDLVQVNQTNGNGTVADVKRVEARLVDAKTAGADAEAELQNAVDRFRRLVQQEPGNLKPVPVLTKFMPKSSTLAIEVLPHSSSHLLGLSSGIRAIELEAKAKSLGNLPQVILQVGSQSKFYAGHAPTPYKNDFDASAMLGLSYKFLDGGLANAQMAQIRARLDQQQSLYDFDRDEAEADLRQLFTAIEAARGKSQALAEGLDASARARELYTEQFRGGKRTLFELLDIQTAYFTASRNQIVNFFEEQKGVYSVLKTLGLLTQVIANPKLPNVQEDVTTNSIGTHVPFPEPLVDWTSQLMPTADGQVPYPQLPADWKTQIAPLLDDAKAAP